MDVSIVVATYGERHWLDLACERATRSALAQDVPVIYVHGLTLHGARNAGLAQVETEHVVFLDADDELAPGYIAAMAAGSADLRAPAVQYVRHNGPCSIARVPRVAGHTHACDAGCLEHGNWLCVGTAAPTQLLRDVGGWRDFPWSEDWDLWLRCWKAGASIEAVPAAIYVAEWRRDSRNRAPDSAFKRAAHEAIHAANFPVAGC